MRKPILLLSYGTILLLCFQSRASYTAPLTFSLSQSPFYHLFAFFRTIVSANTNQPDINCSVMLSFAVLFNTSEFNKDSISLELLVEYLFM